MTAPYIAYLPPEPVPKWPGLCWVTRVLNLEDPRCPIRVWDATSRMQVHGQVTQTFVLNRAEHAAMTSTRH